MIAVTGVNDPLLAQRTMKARRTGGKCHLCGFLLMRGEFISLPHGSRVRWIHRDCLIRARQEAMEESK